MKFHSSTVSTIDNKSYLSIHATDQMRRPVQITITVTPIDAGVPAAPVLSMDPVEMSGLLRGLAAIAWNEFDWRPAGLAQIIDTVVKKMKSVAVS